MVFSLHTCAWRAELPRFIPTSLNSRANRSRACSPVFVLGARPLVQRYGHSHKYLPRSRDEHFSVRWVALASSLETIFLFFAVSFFHSNHVARITSLFVETAGDMTHLCSIVVSWTQLSCIPWRTTHSISLGSSVENRGDEIVCWSFVEDSGTIRRRFRE
jgi:hypothetical protein